MRGFDDGPGDPHDQPRAAEQPAGPHGAENQRAAGDPHGAGDPRGAGDARPGDPDGAADARGPVDADGPDNVDAAAGPPRVPGVLLAGRPVADAGAGEVWSGTLDGTPCVARFVPMPAEATRRVAESATAWRLVELRHPHLVPVLAVLPAAGGLAVVTATVPDAVSLARVLAARGRLEPGEVVTVGLPMAQALAAAHAAGLGHGALTPADVLLEPSGRPVLAGVGVAALAAAGENAGLGEPERVVAPTTDVHDLADLLLTTMAEATGPEAAAVAVAVATALVDEPARRPSAAELAGALAHSILPRPVRLPTRPWPAPTSLLPPATPPPPPPAPPEPAGGAAPAGGQLAGPPEPPRAEPRPPAAAAGVVRGGGGGGG
ncbi:MAG: hypothetical protein IRZ08_12280, partial [Frankia sp.]|nr:hypothetical protein [Frankia sp.]